MSCLGKSTEEIVGPNGLLKQLTKALFERAMNAEMSHHLGYEKHAAGGWHFYVGDYTLSGLPKARSQEESSHCPGLIRPFSE